MGFISSKSMKWTSWAFSIQVKESLPPTNPLHSESHPAQGMLKSTCIHDDFSSAFNRKAASMNPAIDSGQSGYGFHSSPLNVFETYLQKHPDWMVTVLQVGVSLLMYLSTPLVTLPAKAQTVVWCRGGSRYVDGRCKPLKRRMQTTRAQDANHPSGRCKPPQRKMQIT